MFNYHSPPPPMEGGVLRINKVVSRRTALGYPPPHRQTEACNFLICQNKGEIDGRAPGPGPIGR